MIVLLETDASLRSALAESLRDDGHAVLEYSSPNEMQSLTALGRITALITDDKLPGGDGLTVANRFHHTHPATPVIIMTDEWTRHLQREVEEHDFLSLVCKPVDYYGLHDLIHQLGTPNADPRP